ncbi:alpha-2-macroglobulin receptor-associated protein [Coccinella septempunctata]|uniref:alpha-2-macroglobulin receptor-associated protein n=1 Tax=Coccinella septempunctata TaxID=41139 RepID=UPI001D08F34A|nr:alpha-2-macroglobulin receptor-associated protein [Coccinella septempunctata]
MFNMNTQQLLLFFILLNTVYCHNKYSKDLNTPEVPEEDSDFRPHYLQHLDKPFRMSKLNLLWSKAVVRLSEPKLKSLLGDLKLHDKLEITYKHDRAQGKDKDGLKEEELRNKLKRIMLNYNLLDQIESVDDGGHKAMNSASNKYINKSLFRDKKLSKLWEKAEHSGFTADELETLREEFLHHQNKVDQYYALLHEVKNNTDDKVHENSIDEKLDKFNEIDRAEENDKPNKDYLHKANLIREQSKVIKEGYDHLALLTAKGPSSREFVEPKVQGLWKIAVESEFSPDELESLRVELLHYENRLMKLRHLQAEQAINEEKFNLHKAALGSKPGDESFVKDQIKKHARKVEKIHLDLESRILERHGGEL